MKVFPSGIQTMEEFLPPNVGREEKKKKKEKTDHQK